MKIGKVKVYGSFVLMWAALLYIDAGRLLYPVWCCAMIHELGHWLPLRLLGGRVDEWELSAGGVRARVAPGMGLSYPAEIFCVLAGPLASFLCALCFANMDGIMAWSGICVIQGAFNMLPASGLDGGRALSLALQWAGATNEPAVLKVATFVTAASTAIFSAFAFVRSGYSPAMLAAGLYAAISVFGRNDTDA